MQQLMYFHGNPKALRFIRWNSTTKCMFWTALAQNVWSCPFLSNTVRRVTGGWVWPSEFMGFVQCSSSWFRPCIWKSFDVDTWLDPVFLTLKALWDPFCQGINAMQWTILELLQRRRARQNVRKMLDFALGPLGSHSVFLFRGVCACLPPRWLLKIMIKHLNTGFVLAVHWLIKVSFCVHAQFL